MNKETLEQIKVFRYASYIRELRWMFAIPNGGYRIPSEAVILKRQGVKAGVSDFFLPLARRGYHGLFIEMKIHPNRASKLQKEFMTEMINNGYKCSVCFSADEAIETINKYIGLKDIRIR